MDFNRLLAKDTWRSSSESRVSRYRCDEDSTPSAESSIPIALFNAGGYSLLLQEGDKTISLALIHLRRG